MEDDGRGLRLGKAWSAAMACCLPRWTMPQPGPPPSMRDWACRSQAARARPLAFHARLGLVLLADILHATHARSQRPCAQAALSNVVQAER